MRVRLSRRAPARIQPPNPNVRRFFFYLQQKEDYVKPKNMVRIRLTGVRLSPVSPDRKAASSSQTDMTHATKAKGGRSRFGSHHDWVRLEPDGFRTLKQAVLVRKAAEEKYFKPILGHATHGKLVPYVDNGKIVDLTGKEYPHFKVIRFLGMTANRRRYWLCRCECGNTFIASSSDIRERKVLSCGCIQEEVKPKKENLIRQCNCILLDGANLTKMANRKANKNSKSGTKGIYQDRCGTWYAKIMFKGKEHRARCFSKIQAIYKRRELEMQYFDPVIEGHKDL